MRGLFDDEKKDLVLLALQDVYDEFRYLPMNTEFHEVPESSKIILQKVLSHHLFDLSEERPEDFEVYGSVRKMLSEKKIREVLLAELNEGKDKDKWEEPRDMMLRIWERLWDNFNELIQEGHRILGPLYFDDMDGELLAEDPEQMKYEDITARALLRKEKREEDERKRASKVSKGSDAETGAVTLEVSQERVEAPLPDLEGGGNGAG